MGTERLRDRKMTKDEMIDWFKSAPKGSRHQRMLWAADKIAQIGPVRRTAVSWFFVGRHGAMNPAGS
jgi:hypothetical protein